MRQRSSGMTTSSPWDEETDVIVVGGGYAGATAAIAAHDAGADVALLEKMPDPGGISICSGGGLRIAYDAEAALQYLQATEMSPTDHISLTAAPMAFLIVSPDLGDFRQRIYPSRLSVCPAAALSHQFHSLWYAPSAPPCRRPNIRRQT